MISPTPKYRVYTGQNNSIEAVFYTEDEIGPNESIQYFFNRCRLHNAFGPALIKTFPAGNVYFYYCINGVHYPDVNKWAAAAVPYQIENAED
jgi:hypothetical protein